MNLFLLPLFRGSDWIRDGRNEQSWTKDHSHVTPIAEGIESDFTLREMMTSLSLIVEEPSPFITTEWVAK